MKAILETAIALVVVLLIGALFAQAGGWIIMGIVLLCALEGVYSASRPEPPLVYTPPYIPSVRPSEGTRETSQQEE